MQKEKDIVASYLSKVVSGEQASREKNKVDVRIAGNTFTVIAGESEEYIRSVAKYVDHKISTVGSDNRLPLLDTAILACCNLADEQFKSNAVIEEMRSQLKAYLDDITQLRTEVNNLRQELSKAKKK